MSIALIVLAAGQGTRMKSDRPKVLHEIGGVPMFAHALASGRALDPARRILVVGHGAAAVRAAAAALDPSIEIVHQPDQRGTADAVSAARQALAGFSGDLAVLYGDTPFIRPETLAAMSAARDRHDLVVLGFEAADPARYGRLVMDGDRLERIVEWKDASSEERAITFCNSGIMLADAQVLLDLADAVGSDNAAGEKYLTDVIELAARRGLSATAIRCDEAETLGINSRADLAAAEAAFQRRARAAALDAGVTLIAPDSVHFALDTEIAADTVIEPNVFFGPGVTVGKGAHIRAFSHIEGAHVGPGAIVGPFARLRPGAELGSSVHVGNFVEIKNSTLADGAKVNHLSYIGDASVGAATNIGAGTITCNYDGISKHRTEIGAGAFIGSDTMLVAPVRVGDGAMTATGTVVTEDVPDGALAISRPDFVVKPGLARRLFEKFKAARDGRRKGQS